jgi:hypothetical protein
MRTENPGVGGSIPSLPTISLVILSVSSATLTPSNGMSRRAFDARIPGHLKKANAGRFPLPLRVEADRHGKYCKDGNQKRPTAYMVDHWTIRSEERRRSIRSLSPVSAAAEGRRLHAEVWRSPPPATFSPPFHFGRQFVERPRACVMALVHSMTSSARASRDWGIVRPRAFAVLRLMTRSSLSICSTGRSLGSAPRRTRWTCLAESRPIV